LGLATKILFAALQHGFCRNATALTVAQAIAARSPLLHECHCHPHATVAHYPLASLGTVARVPVVADETMLTLAGVGVAPGDGPASRAGKRATTKGAAYAIYAPCIYLRPPLARLRQKSLDSPYVLCHTHVTIR